MLTVYDHHCTPDEKKIKNVPNIDSQKLFRVRSMKSKKVLIKKKQRLKFQANANARSTSKMKYGHTEGRRTELTSLTGKPHMRGACSPPIALLLTGMPAKYWPIKAGVSVSHSSCLIPLGSPAITL